MHTSTTIGFNFINSLGSKFHFLVSNFFQLGAVSPEEIAEWRKSITSVLERVSVEPLFN